MSRLYLGLLGRTKPLEMAEAAIGHAALLAPTSKDGIFAIVRDGLRLYARRNSDRYNARPIEPAEWVASYTRKSDPDWLAEQIENELI